jgi:hypothetical protein
LTTKKGTNGDEFDPKNIRGSPATALGRVDGGSFTLSDAMFVRIRAVHLGVGRYPLEGRRSATHLLLYEVSALW